MPDASFSLLDDTIAIAWPVRDRAKEIRLQPFQPGHITDLPYQPFCLYLVRRGERETSECPENCGRASVQQAHYDGISQRAHAGLNVHSLALTAAEGYQRATRTFSLSALVIAPAVDQPYSLSIKRP